MADGRGAGAALEQPEEQREDNDQDADQDRVEGLDPPNQVNIAARDQALRALAQAEITDRDVAALLALELPAEGAQPPAVLADFCRLSRQLLAGVA